MPSNYLILRHPLLLPPSIIPSIRVFSNESVLRIRWQKCWSFSFSISPSNKYSGLISFRMDWLHLLAVQGTLKSPLQHHSSKASILRRSAFFIVQLSHPYLTTGKTIALTRRTFVGKVMSLLFNELPRLVIPFLPRSKCLLISWLQSPSAVILEPPKIKSVTVSTVSPSICHEVIMRNINNLRYADDTTLMAESEEELKSLLMQVKEKSEKVGLKLNISFSNESTLRMRWPKYWSFSVSISPSNEYPGLISFRMDWLDLLAVPRDSQESSPTPQFKSINSSALSFLHSPTLTSIHDHWKNHSLD